MESKLSPGHHMNTHPPAGTHERRDDGARQHILSISHVSKEQHLRQYWKQSLSSSVLPRSLPPSLQLLFVLQISAPTGTGLRESFILSHSLCSHSPSLAVSHEILTPNSRTKQISQYDLSVQAPLGIEKNQQKECVST